ncbi:hypothetical protein ScPMuIL_000277 [Solemya velum]
MVENVTPVHQLGGYYTAKTKYGIRIIALNTNLYNKEDKETDKLSDPADQFAWLDHVLDKSEEKSEKVLIIGHIPPGVHTPGGYMWMNEKHARKFNEVIMKHPDVIVAMHFGHEHTDSFRLYYDHEGEPQIPVFIAPSVTPFHLQSQSAHNPGIRVIRYDRNSGSHLDMLQYYLDLAKSNDKGESVWEKEYTFTQDYGIPDLAAKSLGKLIEKIEEKGSSKIRLYNQRQSVSAPKDLIQACGHSCEKEIACGFAIQSLDNYKKCVGE